MTSATFARENAVFVTKTRRGDGVGTRKVGRTDADGRTAQTLASNLKGLIDRVARLSGEAGEPPLVVPWHVVQSVVGRLCRRERLSERERNCNSKEERQID